MENVRKSRKVEMVFHVRCLITGYMEFFPSIGGDIMENFPCITNVMLKKWNYEKKY